MGKKKGSAFFERFANAASKFTGSSTAFLMAVFVVLAWAVVGPIFDFSETWQLVINTGTTIVTFLMVFLIQKAQNKDSKAIQLKLNELIAANRFASNRMVDIEDLTEDELDQLHKFYVKISDLAEKEEDIHQSHSIDAAVTSNAEKTKTREANMKIRSDEGVNVGKPIRQTPTTKNKTVNGNKRTKSS